MNRNAIALAADSAVTVGDHTAIHNSANKLFSLSRVAPVGMIVYANATLMNVPMEIIVKQYKKQLGNKVFPLMGDYVADFLKFLEDQAHFFRFDVDINEKSYIFRIFSDLMQGLLIDYQNHLLPAQIGGNPLDENCLQRIATDTVNETIGFVDRQPKRGDYNYAQYVKDHYLKVFIDSVKNDPNLKWLNDEQIQILCEKSCELYDSSFERSGYVGIAVAGYGENEIYPHLIHLHISGMINSTLRYNEVENVEISETRPASIAPFAQTDVMQTFLFGINDNFINDLSVEIPRQIDECISSVDDCFVAGKKSVVQAQMKSVTSSIIHHMTETANNNYLKPIIQSVSSLPIEELALLAESMINITSLRRKVAIDSNIGTVGGPIDVSIISKGDGFIWLKRKHYFEKKYNPQYFYSHFRNCEEDKNNGKD